MHGDSVTSWGDVTHQTFPGESRSMQQMLNICLSITHNKRVVYYVTFERSHLLKCLFNIQLRLAQIRCSFRFSGSSYIFEVKQSRNGIRDYDLWKVINCCGTWKALSAQMDFENITTRAAGEMKNLWDGRNTRQCSGKVMAFVVHKSRPIDCKNKKEENGILWSQFRALERRHSRNRSFILINCVDPQYWVHAASHTAQGGEERKEWSVRWRQSIWAALLR